VLIQSANVTLKLDDFQKEKSIYTPSSETERKVFKLVNKWINGEKSFTFHTSGSTGQAKVVSIEREKIIQSANFTFDYIDPERKISNSLLCLDPAFIGGAMVVFRALVRDIDLYIVEPSSHITNVLPTDYQTGLVSMVPMQFNHLKHEEINRFKNILIGGAPMDIISNLGTTSNVFSTYGMTETVSHVALRRLNESHFEMTGDTKVSNTSDGCLQFNGTITNHKWLKTNDLGEVISSQSFRWIGRKDFVINSGGVKLNPETIERKLKDQVASMFIITSIPDELLHEKVVLVIEGETQAELDFGVLDKYERPKLVLQNQKILTTPSGKIDRRATRTNLLASLK